MQYLVNVQRQFGGNWVIEGGYLGTLSHHLYGFQDANQAIPFGYLGNGASTPVSTRLPYLNYGVIQLVADGANANYNSLQSEGDAALQPGPQRDQFLHIRQIDRRHQRHSRAGL